MALVGQSKSSNMEDTGDEPTRDGTCDSSQTNLTKEDYYLELVRKLKTELADKTSECEMLQIKLSYNNSELENLSRDLDSCRLTIYLNNQDLKRNHEQVNKGKKLEEDYLKLMSDFLDLGEQTNNYKQNLLKNYIAKSNALNNYDCVMSTGALKYELQECKMELDNRLVELSVAMAKVRNLEEDNLTKEKNIQELKKTLDDAKVTHKHEVTVLEEYIQCLKNTITSYEKTLLSYIEAKN